MLLMLLMMLMLLLMLMLMMLMLMLMLLMLLRYVAVLERGLQHAGYGIVFLRISSSDEIAHIPQRFDLFKFVALDFHAARHKMGTYSHVI